MMVAVFSLSVTAFCVCWRCWGVDHGGKKKHGTVLGKKTEGDEEDGEFHSMEGESEGEQEEEKKRDDANKKAREKEGGR